MVLCLLKWGDSSTTSSKGCKDLSFQMSPGHVSQPLCCVLTCRRFTSTLTPPKKGAIWKSYRAIRSLRVRRSRTGNAHTHHGTRRDQISEVWACLLKYSGHYRAQLYNVDSNKWEDNSELGISVKVEVSLACDCWLGGKAYKRGRGVLRMISEMIISEDGTVSLDSPGLSTESYRLARVLQDPFTGRS